MHVRCALLVVFAILGAPTAAWAEVAPITLPDGRGLSSAGQMVAAGDFPGQAIVASGRVLTDATGSAPNEIDAFDPATLALGGRTVPSAPPSTSAAPWAQTGHLATSPDGQTLYAAGGANAVVETFSLPPGATAPIQTGTVAAPGFAGGLAVDPDGRHLWATLPFNRGASYDKGASVARLDPQGGAPVTVPTGAQPWDVGTGTAGGRALVAVADRDAGTVTVIDATTHQVIGSVAVGRHPAAPTFTTDGRLLVLASLDDDLVEVDPVALQVVRRVSVGSDARLGGGPSALAVSRDGRRAYVALSADNALAVVSRPADGAMAVEGRIPTAIYPTGVAMSGDERTLFVSSGKGTGQNAGVAAGTPIPATQPVAPGPTGVGVTGALESILVPDAATLATDTAAVARNNAPQAVEPAAAPCLPGAVSPIQHVVYVIRENKTYDQEFGDEPGGSPANVMYPRQVTPNAHALADRFGLLQSFFADEEVSDTGHQWVMGSVANDWVERLSQQAYGLDGAPRQGAELGNGSDTLWSPRDYLLDAALQTGISFRDYGEFYRRDQSRDGPAVSDALDSHIVHAFPGFGFAPDVPDTKRIEFWRGDFARDVHDLSFPALEVVYLPEDHTTQGLSSTPQQQVADADLALGQMVDTLSHSPYWSSTAVFMTEDDPQSGTDSVDQHRTLGLVVSPWTKPGQMVTQHLDQTAMLRAVEGLLGMPALTEFDARAADMGDLFAAAPAPASFAALTPQAPSAGAAQLAALRRAARAAIPRGTSLDDLSPALQLRLGRLAYAQIASRYRRSAERAAAPRAVARDAAAAAACTPGDVLHEQQADLTAGGSGAGTPGSAAAVAKLRQSGRTPVRIRILGVGRRHRDRYRRLIVPLRVRFIGAGADVRVAHLVRLHGRHGVVVARARHVVVSRAGRATLALVVRRGHLARGHYRVAVVALMDGTRTTAGRRLRLR